MPDRTCDESNASEKESYHQSVDRVACNEAKVSSDTLLLGSMFAGCMKTILTNDTSVSTMPILEVGLNPEV